MRCKIRCFNSRTPCGVRQYPLTPPFHPISFNSRTPCGVRRRYCLYARSIRCFNSRTPCGVRPYTRLGFKPASRVSIHAPRVGCDVLTKLMSVMVKLFQFTHPVWGATKAKTFKDLFLEFQFTHPVWGATAHELVHVALEEFQFTHPVWGATL